MNILHVIDQLSMTHGGGAAKVTYQLAEEQARLGHNVAIITSSWHLDGQRPEGVKVKAFKLWGSPFGLRVAPGMLFANADRGAAIHLHNYRTFPNLCFANLGLPYVLEAHGSMPTRNKTADSLFWHRTIFKDARAYVANSELEVPQYQAEGARPERITVIPPGIDWREFENLPPRQPSDKKTILFLGRLHPIKGADILIKAFTQMKRKDVRLVIAGNMEATEYAKSLPMMAVEANANGCEIDFVGPLYGKDKIQAYVDADLYVLPSRYEMFGVTVLEALACGTPVVVMKGQGCASSIKMNHGVVCDQCVPLTRGIEIGLREWRHMANSRRSFARQFAWDKLAYKHLELYERVVYG